MKKGEMKDIHPVLKHHRTLGQKAADILTRWAGSWTFIILFFVFLLVWVVTSGIFLLQHLGDGLVDPYPFILLNLILSCIAAIQAPIILMSQNREAQVDRQRAQYDYEVNRKAEREIEELKRQLDRIENRLVKKDFKLS